ncbi:MAG: 2-succinyl-5-enolpyruvyl-6-hydroxy-3-cyclohexene-1-carboxylic-acid synthase, partial [Bacteroidales bacterium]
MLMYSDKKNIRELVTLLLAHGIDHIVLSPGSRNAPLLHTFSQHPDFTCFTVVDERSAGFFALGLAQNLQRPVALCCTSGSALLNYAPAVSEAYYQKIPLLVISADRPQQWLGQQDGQMIPQQQALTGICNAMVQLPEIQTKEEAWYCNRLINEAILALDKNGKGPSHINIPVSEPLYKFTEDPLPVPRVIRKRNGKPIWDAASEADVLRATPKCWILAGQLPPDNGLSDLLSRVARKFNALIVCEHTANLDSADAIRNMDALLYTLSEEEQAALAPDLLISFGGHLVSKRIKQYLRKQAVSTHWWISDTDEVIDSFGTLTDILSVDPATFFEALLQEEGAKETNYSQEWILRSNRLSNRGEAWAKKAEYSDLTVVGDFLDSLPEGVALHLGNSSSIRNAQLFPLPPDTKVYSNRGVSGIDGVVSTAVGFAALNNQTTFL